MPPAPDYEYHGSSTVFDAKTDSFEENEHGYGDSWTREFRVYTDQLDEEGTRQLRFFTRCNKGVTANVAAFMIPHDRIPELIAALEDYYHQEEVRT